MDEKIKQTLQKEKGHLHQSKLWLHANLKKRFVFLRNQLKFVYNLPIATRKSSESSYSKASSTSEDQLGQDFSQNSMVRSLFDVNEDHISNSDSMFFRMREISSDFFGRLVRKRKRSASCCDTIGIRRPPLSLSLSHEGAESYSESYLKSIQLSESASISASSLWESKGSHLRVIVDAGSDSDVDEIEVALKETKSRGNENQEEVGIGIRRRWTYGDDSTFWDNLVEALAMPTFSSKSGEKIGSLMLKHTMKQKTFLNSVNDDSSLLRSELEPPAYINLGIEGLQSHSFQSSIIQSIDKAFDMPPMYLSPKTSSSKNNCYNSN